MTSISDALLAVETDALVNRLDAIKAELLEEADRISAERIIATLEEVVGRKASKEERYLAMLRSAFS